LTYDKSTMKSSSSPPFVISNRPAVSVFADFDVLPLSLLEKLLANFCKVKIFSEDIMAWQEKTLHLGHARYFSFASESAFSELSRSSYVIYVNLYPENLASEERTIKEVIKYSSEYFAKAIFVLPYFLETEEQKKLCTFVKTQIGKEENFGVIYVGQIFSPRMVLKRGILLHEILSDLERGSRLKIPDNNFEVYPTFAVDVAREIVKSLFSFGYFGQEVSMYSAKTTFDNFVKYLARLRQTENPIESGTKYVRAPGVDKEIHIAKNLESFVPDTVEWFQQNPNEVLPQIKPREASRVKEAAVKVSFPRIKRILTSPMFVWGGGLVAGFLLLPFLMLIISILSLVIFGKTFVTGKLVLAESAAGFADVSANLANKESGFLMQIPLLGMPYKETASLGNLIEDYSVIAKRAVSIAKQGKSLVKNILGKDSYNLSGASESLGLDLDVLYKDLGFLQGEINDLMPISARLVAPVSARIDLGQLKERLFLAKTAIDNLPDLLGADKQKSYLVLLQNNMELRPTGGFIGSYALLTFDQGKLVDTNVSDIYSADGQLQGHVEPPAPIKKYLGEANWYLRDSNWDPDFPTSATRAEWFLGKEINKSVDGVIGIDLEFIKGLIKVTGPITLSDFNQTIGSSDLYEKTQTQVEKDFFPGSQKKTNYLTALTRTLLTNLENPSDSLILGFSKETFSALNARHIQVFVHNRDVQNALSNIGWDGAVNQPTCEGNCYPDWFGIVDANMGVNKANYYIGKESFLGVRFDNDNITRELTINYKNSANTVLGAGAKYKNYVRILVPKGADFADVQVTIADKTQTLKPEINDTQGRREAGVLIEIPAGTKASVKFVWQTPLGISFAQPGEYRLYVRKQAGTIADTTTLKFSFPEGVVAKTSPKPTLTVEGSLEYNTTLAGDLFALSRW